MRIRKFTLLSALSIGVFFSVLTLSKDKKERYFPRANTYFTEYEREYRGAQEYLSSIRSNRETGYVSTQDIMTAHAEADKLRNNSKTLGLTWSAKGPDNVGGRTRSIIIDINDTSHIYSGGVSGGVWESFDGAISWQPYDTDFKISNVSAMAQGPDGSIYVGTGSNFDGANNFKSKSSHFVGTGLYKLTGNGESELLVGPVITNDFATEWTVVNDIAVNPNNKDHILAAIGSGLMQSVDGGETWVRAPGSTFEPYYDVQFSSDGKIAATSPRTIHVSLDEGQSYSQSSFNGANRIEVAIAPSNSNIMYALMARFNGCDFGVYRSFDAGANWSVLDFKPNIFGSNCQGFYDNEIIVHPNNSGKIYVGGVGMYQWNQSSEDPAPVQGEWKSIATTGSVQGARNPFYVHADVHKFAFNPENPNTLYIGSDGGISICFNADANLMVYSESNLGYNITQFYDIGAGPTGMVVGGTQDNGSPLVGFGFNTGRSSVDAFVGDGFDAHLSTINPKLGLVSSQFGTFARLQGIGTNLTNSTINFAGVTSQSLSDICGAGNLPRCSQVFYTSTGFWESFKHPETKDSVRLVFSETDLPPIPAGTKIDYKSKNNDRPMVGTVPVDLFPTDTFSGVVSEIQDEFISFDGINEFILSFDTLRVDTNTKQIRIGRRSQTPLNFNYTVDQTIQWTNIFDIGGSRPLSVKVTDTTIEYTDFPIEFSYRTEFADSIQSMANIANVRGRLSNAERNVWMTRDLLKGGSVEVPRWFKVAGSNSSPNPIRNGGNIIANEFSRDGDHLFLGTIFGEIYRVDNLNDIDISQISFNVQEDSIIENITECHLIGTFINRSVTGIAIDPNNGNNVVVTLGNYGNTSYVFRSTNALSANPTFEGINGSGGGRLPQAPVYDAVIDFRDSNKVIVGTELGIFATENAFAADRTTIEWTEENAGMGRAPVMSMQQAIFGFDVGGKNQGIIYAGTHGRGIYETDRLVGLDDIDAGDLQGKPQPTSIQVYPNPVKTNTKVNFEVFDPSAQVNIRLYNIRGQMVYEQNLMNVRRGRNTVELDLSDLDNGAYIVRIVADNRISSGKLIKN